MPSLHNRLAASASGRWIRCPGSIALIESLKDKGLIPKESVSGPAAQLGTLCHEILEYCIINSLEPVKLTKRLIKQLTPKDLSHIVITPADLLGVQDFWEFVESRKGDFNQTFAERRYDMSELFGVDFGGTADVTQAQFKGTLHIGDYKNGRTPVDHVDNYQLKTYALGAYEELNAEYKFKDIMMSIGQPNSYHTDGSNRFDIITVDELLVWRDEKLAPAIHKIRHGSTELVSGEKQCEWCDARNHCVERAQKDLVLAETEFEQFADNEEVPDVMADVALLTDDQVEKILDKKDAIVRFLNDVQKRAETKAEETGSFKSYSFESKPGNRAYIDERDVKSCIKQHRIPLFKVMDAPAPKVLGIGKLEGFLRSTKKWPKTKVDTFMAKITYRPPGKPQLRKRKNEATLEFSEFAQDEHTNEKPKKRNVTKVRKSTKIRRRKKV